MNFSVLMSVYYKENPIWFKEALNSVFNQTVLPEEIVLIRDGKLTQELDSVIADFEKRYPIFNIITNDTNLGLGLSLQKGVLACSNEIIARMDTDDIIPSTRFEKELEMIENGYDLVGAWMVVFDETIDNKIALKKYPEHHDDIVKYAKRRSPVCHPACMMRKKAVLAAGNYTHCPYFEDYPLWVRMIMSGARFYNIQEVLYYLRTTDGQIQRRGGLKYLRNELSVSYQFYKMGFYSFSDLVTNCCIRSIARLSPEILRKVLYKKIWNTP